MLLGVIVIFHNIHTKSLVKNTPFPLPLPIMGCSQAICLWHLRHPLRHVPRHWRQLHWSRLRKREPLRGPLSGTLLCRSIQKARHQTKHPTGVKTQQEDPKEPAAFRDIQGNPSGLHSRALTQKVGQGGRGQLTERTNHRAAHEKVRVLQAKKMGSHAKHGG